MVLEALGVMNSAGERDYAYEELPDASLGYPKPSKLSRWHLHIGFVLGVLSTLLVVSAYSVFLPGSRSTSSTLVPDIVSTPVEMSRNEFLGMSLDETKLAFLLETRHEGHLLPLLLHMIMTVPREWPFLIVGSDANIGALRQKDHIQALESSRKLRFELLDPRWSFSNHSITQIFTDLAFWEHYMGKAENILVWQSDSIMCANSDHTLNDWLQYDWIGAPWPERWPQFQVGGNGGFSLRRMSAMRRHLSLNTYDPNQGIYNAVNGSSDPEDAWFVGGMRDSPDYHYALAPAAEAKEFSMDMVYEPNPMAIHIGQDGKTIRREVFGSEDQQRRILQDWCPEIKLVIPSLRARAVV